MFLRGPRRFRSPLCGYSQFSRDPKWSQNLTAGRTHGKTSQFFKVLETPLFLNDPPRIHNFSKSPEQVEDPLRPLLVLQGPWEAPSSAVWRAPSSSAGPLRGPPLVLQGLWEAPTIFLHGPWEVPLVGLQGPWEDVTEGNVKLFLMGRQEWFSNQGSHTSH